MIRHKELTVEGILEAMRDSANVAKAIGRPTTHEETVEATEAMQRIAVDAANIRVVCVGCEASGPLAESVPCVCGGFVCPACLRVEGEGECHHEPPELPPGVNVMSDEDDDE